jgi:hypothetical protein
VDHVGNLGCDIYRPTVFRNNHTLWFRSGFDSEHGLPPSDVDDFQAGIFLVCDID